MKKGVTESYNNGKWEKTAYDANKDGWLDPVEIMKITDITSTDGIAVSSLKGIEYFNVQGITLDNYTGNVVEIQDEVEWIRISLRGTTGNVKVITPQVREIAISLDNSAKKIAEVDLLQCNEVRYLEVSANKNVELLKLPKNTYFLKSLEFSGFELKNQNFSVYKNLKTIELRADAEYFYY